ncbi:MAG: G5 domain-containing protein [Clostridia bacterium]|nr:G5 domain-containing protein [Clostridia bacterium]
MKGKKRKIVLLSFIGLLLPIFIFTLNSGEISDAISKQTVNNDYFDITGTKLNEQPKIDEIIEKNSNTVETQEIIKEQIDLEYITKYRNDNSLPKGVMQVEQAGQNGLQEIAVRKIYVNNELQKEEQLDSRVIKSSVNKIVKVGTAAYTSSYNVKIGDTLYVTPINASIKFEPNKDSGKIVSIGNGKDVKLLEMQDEWYKIQYGKYVGWIEKENLTYLSQAKIEQIASGYKSRGELLATLNFDMSLNKKSGLSLEQFNKVLADNSGDKNSIFNSNAQYFYYAEQQYNVNGIFIAAIGIHESAWGTSKISKDKKNLFGYGAYDSSAYTSAYDFKDYNEGIDLIARVLVKYYLNPKGTSIYEGQSATGSNYNGPTLRGVNTKYATDKKWCNGVYKWMEYLYNRL